MIELYSHLVITKSLHLMQYKTLKQVKCITKATWLKNEAFCLFEIFFRLRFTETLEHWSW